MERLLGRLTCVTACQSVSNAGGSPPGPWDGSRRPRPLQRILAARAETFAGPTPAPPMVSTERPGRAPERWWQCENDRPAMTHERGSGFAPSIQST
jgi:hypothetical protein